MIVSEDGLRNSPFSEDVELTIWLPKFSATPDVELIDKQDGMNLYSIPLTDLSEPGTAVERFCLRQS